MSMASPQTEDRAPRTCKLLIRLFVRINVSKFGIVSVKGSNSCEDYEGDCDGAMRACAPSSFFSILDTLLLLRSSCFSRSSRGNPSIFTTALSDKSMLSNWFCEKNGR